MSVKFFIPLLLTVMLVYQQVSSGPALSSDFIEQENSCREVCGLCNCDGFYCIDECICECNINDTENLQCIADMKKECDKNGLEYELIMQESTKERFLRQIKAGPHPFKNFADSFVIMKQKRDNPVEPKAVAAPVDTIVGAKKDVSPTTSAPSSSRPIFTTGGSTLGAVRSFPVQPIVQPGYASQPASASTQKPSVDPSLGAPKPEEEGDAEKEKVGLSISPPFSMTSAALDNRLAFETLWGQSPSKMLISLRDSISHRRPSTAFPPLVFTLPTTSTARTFPTLPPLNSIDLSSLDLSSILGKAAPESVKDDEAEDEE
ncbi:hypothetical protein PVAND_008664 [Polypedilum vanderplanki]|uniref:Uncharacterized protein n=1 Tax=Polypedilum vanderplanki TaxID=319348 RepID=A0A9J6CBE9_POLVA|nr:hypothetical protein PVAND_008664 [Polypedilum vanderplanki]